MNTILSVFICVDLRLFFVRSEWFRPVEVQSVAEEH